MDIVSNPRLPREYMPYINSKSITPKLTKLN